MAAFGAATNALRQVSRTTFFSHNQIEKEQSPPGRTSRRAPPRLAYIILMFSSHNDVVGKEFPEFLKPCACDNSAGQFGFWRHDSGVQ
jgi:hypothetical protein